ncbi:MAG: efflux RND transporter periplasmic adaptor subunit [Acidobacteriota bacterium]|nr:efflux RND transporter periplasmic adaptor subunit [Acidobacteriota bacterium]
MIRVEWLAGVLLPVVLTAAGCSGTRPSASIPTFEVQPGVFEIEIKGFGELEAARSTPIEVPSRLPGRQRVVYLLDDGTTVAEGDLIARLDGETILRWIRKAKDAIRKVDFQLEAKQKALEKEKTAVEASLLLLEQEKRDAESYAPRDESLFSRNEIIDAQVDLELLETKIELARSKIARYVQRAEAEMEILRLQRKTQQVRLTQFEEARRSLEVRAPHAGVFFRKTNWRGEKMSVGNTVWGGGALGELPDLTRMEAKLHVLESEAAGLAEGLEVSIALDAHPDLRYPGTVKSVQPIANPIESESPVKYFELTIELDQTDQATMKPRSQVLASIFVARESDVVSIPNQALFQKAGKSWVWVQQGDGFERREVETGRRSLSRTVVVRGLTGGEVIALSEPSTQGEG